MSRRLVLFNPCQRTRQTVAVKGVKCWNLIHNAGSHLCECLLNPCSRSWTQRQRKAHKSHGIESFNTKIRLWSSYGQSQYPCIYWVERKIYHFDLVNCQCSNNWKSFEAFQTTHKRNWFHFFIFSSSFCRHCLFVAMRLDLNLHQDLALTSSQLWHLGQRLWIKYAWRKGTPPLQRYLYTIEHSSRTLAQKLRRPPWKVGNKKSIRKCPRLSVQRDMVTFSRIMSSPPP